MPLLSDLQRWNLVRFAHCAASEELCEVVEVNTLRSAESAGHGIGIN